MVRGPVVYVLPIAADWQNIGAEAAGPDNMKEEWNVVMADGAVWNVALELNLMNPETSLKPVKLDVPPVSPSWKNPPIGLQVRARRLPDWSLDLISNNPCTSALPKEIKPRGKVFQVMLVLFGFTQLRMTVLPVIDETEKKEIQHD